MIPRACNLLPANSGGTRLEHRRLRFYLQRCRWKPRRLVYLVERIGRGEWITYDANGNQITKTQTPSGTPFLYGYDAADRLISFVGGGTTSAFAYDGDGNRISQSVGTGTYAYVNDIASSLPTVLQESGPDGDIIRNALLKSTSPVAGLGLDVYLQGSYANATNIYGDSDIDVVVFYPTSFYKDMSALTQIQQQLHEKTFPPATYNWTDLRDDVLGALQSHYAATAVTQGRKSLKVVTSNGRKPSDVVPPMQFRRYATFVDRNNLSAHWGIQFFDSMNNPIVNYPKYHIERGEDKNSSGRTAGQYKPTVRIFKNFRNYLVDRNLLVRGVAPSYYIECALHNIPDRLFIGEYTTTIPAILRHLLVTPYAEFRAQNGVTTLVGNGPTQWSESDFATFVVAAQDGWDNWR